MKKERCFERPIGQSSDFSIDRSMHYENGSDRIEISHIACLLELGASVRTSVDGYSLPLSGSLFSALFLFVGPFSRSSTVSFSLPLRLLKYTSLVRALDGKHKGELSNPVTLSIHSFFSPKVVFFNAL